ncbi:MAG TPA: tripartite tricarboxylate transporter substrate-binding protein [Candidatus Binatia bacterium]|nr:tripartite tricarboxylate transporter substrate-binding protein [Candidatus Binatia bacterium]
MKMRFFISALIGLVLLERPVQGTTHEFYKGKTIRVVVGYAPGGGYDFYARLIARHIGKHIPGNPHLIVENMPGAGSLVSANHLYKLAKPDGLTIGHFNGSLFQLKAMGQKEIEFDSIKFEFVGSVAKVEVACGFSKASGIDSVEKWMAAKVPPRLGATAPGTGGHDVSRILNATLGLPMQLVLGYKSTGDMRVAMERGELNGNCTGWESLKSLWKEPIQSGEMVIVLQALPKPHADLPNVPTAISFAKTDEARQLLQVGVHDVTAISRPFVLPPGTPKERVQLLRKAFTATLNDAAFLADAEKSNLDISPLTGEELEKTVHNLLKLSPPLLAKLKQIISPN